MPKIGLNPAFDEFHGSLDNVTFQMAYGRAHETGINSGLGHYTIKSVVTAGADLK
jgi:hypothetical protein